MQLVETVPRSQMSMMFPSFEIGITIIRCTGQWPIFIHRRILEHWQMLRTQTDRQLSLKSIPLLGQKEKQIYQTNWKRWVNLVDITQVHVYCTHSPYFIPP